MKPRDLKNLWRMLETPEELLVKLPDANFRTAIYAVADIFSVMKKEAIRRGIWDDIKTKKL